MHLNPPVNRILEEALAGQAPDRQACLALLDLHPNSLEASALRAVADFLSRQRFGNAGILLGQIGIDCAPCPGDCQFCTFAESTITQLPHRLSQEEILRLACSFTAGHDLYALFLMAMHTFDFEFLLQTVAAVRAVIPAQTRIVVNVGDFDAVQAAEMRQAGVSGAYHVRRLREGVDTNLDPEDRVATIETIRAAGLDWYTCCEPIGPEHDVRELTDQLFLGVEMGCYQHAAMRRVPVPGTPLAQKGQISERRLAQIVAVTTLAAMASPELQTIAVHEPNALGLVSGANTVYAEAGVNPRDEQENTQDNRGMDITRCRAMLAETGFESLCLGDGSSLPLVL